MKTLNVEKLGKEINNLILVLSKKELKLLGIVVILFFVEFIFHILLFSHLLMLSGVSSVLLAFLFGMICGQTSFGIWLKHGWSFTVLFYRSKFRNNSKLMKFINE